MKTVHTRPQGPTAADRAAMHGVTLGPFVLEGRIGSGGMADVYRGRHARQDVPVAIKVVRWEGSGHSQEYIQSFRNEVRSVARLQHPRIVLVLDQGLVDAAAQAASGGMLTTGTPYLAMELATGGTLLDVPAPLEWLALYPTLLAILDALAHAHARGVIHRDLKPNNVLLCTPQDARPGLKLSDFGLACPSDLALDVAHESRVAGTPQFMAPEQLRGEWRDYGPWTDLYALGCMAYFLCSGRLPFEGPMEQVMHAQLHKAPPTMLLGGGAPVGLIPWVMRLLEKDPRARFDNVADAAHALVTQVDGNASHAPAQEEQLVQRLLALVPSQGQGDAAQTRRVAPRTAPTVHVREDAGAGQDLSRPLPPLSQMATVRGAPNGRPLRLATLAWDTGTAESPTLPLPAPTAGAVVQHAPPARVLPRSWRREGRPPVDVRLLGAGLGLYGVRSIPMVDRDAARDVIWNALRESSETQRPRVVVIRGNAGQGKSRLAEWMTQRMLEVGAARVLRASHAANRGLWEALAGMWTAHLACAGLSRQELQRRVELVWRALGSMDPYELEAWTEFLSPDAPDATVRAKVVFGSQRERLSLMRRSVQRLAARGPLAVWMDDVQWGSSSIALVHHVLETRASDRVPVLFLLTAQEEALAQRPEESRALEALCATHHVRVVTMPPLSTEDHVILVGELLGLEPQLARHVAQRTGGNPLFAVQLVGDWVQRGVLQVGEQGFELGKGQRESLPDHIHQVWLARLSQIPGGLTPAVLTTLELAAVLGTHVDRHEWAMAATTAGGIAPAQLLDPLLALRLLVQVDGSLRFVHSMLRESLERSAAERGCLVSHHALLADLLEARLTERLAGVAPRLARHRVLAGQDQKAAAALLSAAEEHLRFSDYGAAHGALDDLDQVFARLRLPAADERRGQCLVLRGRVFHEEARLEDARSVAKRAEQDAMEQGWVRVAAAAAAVLGQVEYVLGDAAQSTRDLMRARAGFLQVGDAQGAAAALQGLGDAAYRGGNFDQAERDYQAALAEARAVADLTTVARAWWGLGYVRMHRGELAAARQCFEEQLETFERLGSQYGRATGYNALGEVARLETHFEEATAYYRRALDITEAVGAGGRTLIQLNLALCLLQQQKFAAARAQLDAILPEVDASAHITARLSRSMMAACAAHDRDWTFFDSQMDAVEAVLREHPIFNGDTALELSLAGKEAAEGGDPVRARRAYEMARSQWRGLGRQDMVQLMDAALAAVERPKAPGE